MASIKELRTRIKSVGNIKQITRAMEMVASTKLRRFQDRAIASRPYAEEIAGLVGHLAAMLGSEVDSRPLFKEGTGAKLCLLLVTSDRGLCGAYNSNILHLLEGWLAEQAEQGVARDAVDFYVIGRKGAQYVTKRGLVLKSFLVDPPLEGLTFSSAAGTARKLSEAFLSGEYKSVHLLYTAFHSMVKYTPQFVPFLPIEAKTLVGSEANELAGSDMILEPDGETIFDSLVPRYLETRIYNALLESLTSEYASRRVSMKAATDAANDMQKMLQGRYNRLRQEGITKELLDIVGGVEAQR